MADKKISALTGASTPLGGTEVLPIVQSGSTVKVSVADLTAGRSVATGPLTSTHTSGAGVTVTRGTKSLELSGNYAGGDVFSAITATAGMDIALLSGGSEILRAVNTGNVNINNGNLVISTSGKGIDFSATSSGSGTMTSELLADYEEGTWTPAYTNSTPPTTPYTMTVASATYTKIGRQVTVRAWIYTQDVNVTGAAGALQISGLPFASAAGSAGYSAMAIGQARAWAVAPSYGYVDGSVIALMWRAASNADDQTALAINLTAGATANQNQLMFTATYFV